jgi:hypothetical protein
MHTANETFPDETGLAHYYAASHGSAAAAIEAIEARSFWRDAQTRAVLRDLETMRYAERKAALADPDAYTFKVDCAEGAGA